jgi:hypothetical protein
VIAVTATTRVLPRVIEGHGAARTVTRSAGLGEAAAPSGERPGVQQEERAAPRGGAFRLLAAGT